VETGSDSSSREDGRKKKRAIKKEVRTRKVWFKNEGDRGREGQKQINELTRKLLQLNVKDDAYAAVYAQLFVLAPNMMDNLPPPTCYEASTMAATNTTGMLSYPRYPQSSTPMCHKLYSDHNSGNT